MCSSLAHCLSPQLQLRTETFRTEARISDEDDDETESDDETTMPVVVVVVVVSGLLTNYRRARVLYTSTNYRRARVHKVTLETNNICVSSYIQGSRQFSPLSLCLSHW